MVSRTKGLAQCKKPGTTIQDNKTSTEVTWPLRHCYRLDKRLNCLVVGVTPRGSVVHTTHVSYTSRASATGLVSGRQSNRSDLLGYPNLVSG